MMLKTLILLWRRHLFVIGKVKLLSLIRVLPVAVPFFSFNLLLEKLFRVTLIMGQFGRFKQYYTLIYFMSCIFYHKFFFLVKVTSDLYVAKSSNQFLIFTILGPRASFDTDNVPLFLKYGLYWASGASQCFGFVVSFFPCLTGYAFPVLFAVSSSSSWFQMFELASSLSV